ncbi:MAG: hypothetical protein ABIP34_08400 [Rhodoferax sp.]|uniref:hypothetical protein n=1 Tax=Rhodoferax sp. TaxID=50421 RepID=UPI0032677227
MKFVKNLPTFVKFSIIPRASRGVGNFFFPSYFRFDAWPAQSSGKLGGDKGLHGGLLFNTAKSFTVFNFSLSPIEYRASLGLTA